jgi:hypothetical protein
LNTDLSKAYELLGVKPGVSSRELKAAHRDLAKVWHPDRFTHDPRLQEKAQEKLKEINEAYDLLSSGKTPRPTPPPRAAETVYPPPVERHRVPYESRSRGGTARTALVFIFLFAAVFAVTIKVLLDRRSHAPQPQQVEQPESLPAEAATRAEPSARGEATRKPNRTDESGVPEENSTSNVTQPPSTATPALATVTVLIDPESGLLAKSDCPVRSRMTYPSGGQPSSYCNINHAPPPKESKIKSIKDKILH